ncbi:MAG: PHP domain-containing protein [Candidatus Lokiarchaeota archaeon]|nr:PHP domain-containing protein [Candidatus Lokiarchaeota archaeon]
MFIDTHIHSKFSHCSNIGLKELFIRSIDKGLDAIIITDHNILSYEVLEHFPKEYREMLRVYIAEEITTTKGDILAYGITETISKGFSPERTIDLIHEQGAIAVAAHPYRRTGKIGHYNLIGLGDEIYNLDLDAIEVANGGHKREFDKLAAKAARSVGLPGIGGSDAHEASEIGLVSLETPRFDEFGEFISIIKKEDFRIHYNL